MKKPPKLTLICSLICAAGTFWFALAELFDQEEASVPRRVTRALLWLTASAVWTANLVVELSQRKTENVTETDYIEQIEEDDDHD